ncbi:MAG: hypothetical protein AAB703_07520, partial [Pseudomonadota bacterium]
YQQFKPAYTLTLLLLVFTPSGIDQDRIFCIASSYGMQIFRDYTAVDEYVRSLAGLNTDSLHSSNVYIETRHGCSFLNILRNQTGFIFLSANTSSIDNLPGEIVQCPIDLK